MPKPPTSQQKLQKFLVNLMEKPRDLNKLKTDPESAISKAELSDAHKQVLLSGNAVKIKNVIGKAAAGLKFYPHIQTAAKYIVIKHQADDLKATSSDHFHIVITAKTSNVTVGLKPKVPKKGKITKTNPLSLEAFAIHITSNPSST